MSYGAMNGTGSNDMNHEGTNDGLLHELLWTDTAQHGVHGWNSDLRALLLDGVTWQNIHSV